LIAGLYSAVFDDGFLAAALGANAFFAVVCFAIAFF
jgi:hypothetical protein